MATAAILDFRLTVAYHLTNHHKCDGIVATWILETPMTSEVVVTESQDGDCNNLSSRKLLTLLHFLTTLCQLIV